MSRYAIFFIGMGMGAMVLAFGLWIRECWRNRYKEEPNDETI